MRSKLWRRASHLKVLFSCLNNHWLEFQENCKWESVDKWTDNDLAIRGKVWRGTDFIVWQRLQIGMKIVEESVMERQVMGSLIMFQILGADQTFMTTAAYI